ncbi:ABC transporter permease [Variovorax sp. J22P271]|uniref:ABC transporter permease n=1 Tax=Variovorax davisae TaxID=3053515 RepID=UPI0025755875|nr:ABC transporter permease [Variovorax sp. J22P271]MDM0035235.1 ABC transporter permease [Variovorax sp. J22P271]
MSGTISAWPGRLRALSPLVGALAFVALWWWACALKLVDPVLLPTPGAVLRALWDGFVGGAMVHDFLVTVQRTLLSFVIALAIAVPCGIVLGSSKRLYGYVEFLIDFFRSTPASALFPLFLVLFGVGEKTKVAVAAFGAGLTILFNVAYGVMNARKTRQAAARVMGAGRLRIMVDVTLLESLPQTFIGMRAGISFALIIVIVAEMFIGSVDGLGQRVLNAQMVFEMPTMYAAILAAGILGYGLNLVFLLIERRFVHWGGK